MRDADDRREALIAVGEAAIELGAAVVGYHSSGLPGPKGNRETFLWLTDPARRTRVARTGRSSADGARGRAVREITVFTHRRPDDTETALELLAARAAQAGVTLRLDEEETRKHGLRAAPGLAVDAPAKDDVELCVVLGGDGTILRALQRYAGTGVPVFAINFGEIGFLATVEPQDIEDGIRRALSGDFELLRLPAIVLGEHGRAASAGRDASRRPDGDQRRGHPSQGGRAGRRARVRARRRGGRERALRRPGGRDPGGVDRLQPGQRRAGDGVGGGGVRGVVHRPPLDDRACAGRSAG